ncbi:MAG: hypothetical protein NW241_00570 [Bacteroidia bacterium]|nr:hypothetical protein [Bacteroidia bacterium]
MTSPVRFPVARLSGRELVRLCNEKLVCAARDLAEFTQNGINANFIVSLALKCETLEAMQQQTQGQHTVQPLEQELQEAVSRICDVGQQIWSDNPVKRRDYAVHAA